MTPDAPSSSTLRAAGVVFAEDEAALLLEAATDPADLAARWPGAATVSRWSSSSAGPLFDGLRVPVAPGVFVPRRRSEALVETADRLLAPPPAAGDRVVVLDLCCGTGALGVALARRLQARGARGRPGRSPTTTRARRPRRRRDARTPVGGCHGSRRDR